MSGRSSRSTLIGTNELVHQRRDRGVLEATRAPSRDTSGRPSSRSRRAAAGRARARASSASSPHGYQSTGLCGVLAQVRRGLARQPVGHPPERTRARHPRNNLDETRTDRRDQDRNRRRDARVEQPPDDQRPIGAGSRRPVRPLRSRAKGLLFCSGQIPLDPVTGELVGETPGEQARQCLENLAAVCDAAGGTLADAVKLTVYLTDMAAFARGQRGVRARSSRTARRRGSHTRSPRCRRGAQVEIDAVVALPD